MTEFEELIEKLINERKINGEEAIILLKAAYQIHDKEESNIYTYPSTTTWVNNPADPSVTQTIYHQGSITTTAHA